MTTKAISSAWIRFGIITKFYLSFVFTAHRHFPEICNSLPNKTITQLMSSLQRGRDEPRQEVTAIWLRGAGLANQDALFHLMICSIDEKESSYQYVKSVLTTLLFQSMRFSECSQFL